MVGGYVDNGIAVETMTMEEISLLGEMSFMMIAINTISILVSMISLGMYSTNFHYILTGVVVFILVIRVINCLSSTSLKSCCTEPALTSADYWLAGALLSSSHHWASWTLKFWQCQCWWCASSLSTREMQLHRTIEIQSLSSTTVTVMDCKCSVTMAKDMPLEQVEIMPKLVCEWRGELADNGALSHYVVSMQLRSKGDNVTSVRLGLGDTIEHILKKA